MNRSSKPAINGPFRNGTIALIMQRSISQRLIEVLDQVLDGLDSHGEAHQAIVMPMAPAVPWHGRWLVEAGAQSASGYHPGWQLGRKS